MLKRPFDLLVSLFVLAVSSPLTLICTFLIRADGGPALYRGKRVGLDGVVFDMLKFRTMVPNADRIGPDSTANDDPRITKVGAFLRRYKLDELPQLLNVVKGEMSLVGPRPQVEADVALYSPDERRLLSVRPGITDYSSIRFRNEGEILEGQGDADEAYTRLIRPEKIRLGLFYVGNHSMIADLRILFLTVLAVFDHQAALRRIERLHL